MKKIEFFMLGIITALGALFLELLIFTFFNLPTGTAHSNINSLNFTIIFSVFIEELVKIVVLFQILKKLIQTKSEKKNIFLSALIAGLGFSALEITLYLLNPQINRFLLWSDVWGLLTVHTLTFAVLGYALAKKATPGLPSFFLLLPIIFSFHLFYNALVIYQWPFKFYFLFIVFSLLLILAFFWDLKRPGKDKNLLKSKIGL